MIRPDLSAPVPYEEGANIVCLDGMGFRIFGKSSSIGFGLGRMQPLGSVGRRQTVRSALCKQAPLAASKRLDLSGLLANQRRPSPFAIDVLLFVYVTGCPATFRGDGCWGKGLLPRITRWNYGHDRLVSSDRSQGAIARVILGWPD